MTVNYTTNLSLGQPVTGTESGTWGDDVNNSVTSYLDIAIAGGLAITVTTTDVTLTITQGTSVATNIGSTTAQYAILNVSGAMTAARNLILPSSSRQYVINNNTTGGFALTVKGSATSGVTLVNGEKAHVFWNGSDYAKLSNAPGGAGTFSSITNTGLTSGRVVYSTTGGLETDSAGLTFDGTNFATTGTATAAKLIPTGTSATGNGLYLPAANALGLSTNGTNAVYINSSQNVGIGTSSPAVKLDVSGAFAVSTNANGVLPSTTPGGLVISQNYGGGSSGTAEIDFFFNDSTFVGDNGGFRFYQKTGASTAQEMLRLTQNTVIAYTGGTERMRIASDGSVGIGTSSPAYKLDVAGAISTNNNLTFTSTGNRITGDFSNGTVANRLMLQTSTANSASRVGVIPNGTSAAAELFVMNNSDPTNAGFGSIRMNASDFQITATYNGAGTYLPMTFYTGGSERIRIDTSGFVLVGTATTLPVNLASGKFQVLQTGAIGHAACFKTNATSGFAAAAFSRDGNNGAVCEFGYDASTTVGSISVTSVATTYNVTSDYRLKNVVGAVSDSGSRIDALEPVEYTWKSNGLRTRGFLAHKFQEVYAQSVTGTKDEIDADGNPVYQAMQAGSTEVIADLIAEIQSLRKRLTALEST